MRVTILGKRWTLRFVRMPGHWGRVDPPHAHNKEMHIHPRHPTDGELLDTILHESLHCALPEWKEESVEQLASDLTRILKRFGYRIPEPADDDDERDSE